ncbi:Uncharacterized protein APZ42_008039 [Daphnia magna]|uniref:Uncharacterized protein n=1 Tax=Daphnia magna TaxID=35525 RepID=A0A164EWW4_9CRUS|nr:Uncharacterized protein APZ42_008039 [Daphnia magna]
MHIIDSDSSEEDFPGNTHGDTNDMQSIPPYRNDSQMMTIYTPQPTPSPSPFVSRRTTVNNIREIIKRMLTRVVWLPKSS